MNKIGSAWQGSLDMLCGVYSAAYLVGIRGRGRTATNIDRAFSQLVHSAEELGLFTAKHFSVRGYYDRDIVLIINNVSVRRTFGLRAYAFRDQPLKALHNSEKRSLMRLGACAIIQEHGTRHWIAATGLGADGYKCFDPSLNETTKKRQRVRWSQGVLLIKPSVIEAN